MLNYVLLVIFKTNIWSKELFSLQAGIFY